MIVTRRWLEEFIDLSNFSTDKIIETLNSIGQEVEGYKKYEVPKNVVVGEVLECKKHPNADKLNVCKVDVGDEVLEIVCGASNVVNADYVAVAKVGAILPGIEIKKATLRGVDSFGMICSAKEIGFSDFHEGILILDNSLGELKVGEEVGKYLNDEVIELGVTPNRGDSFSIYGIARELSAALNIPLKNLEFSFDELQEGIGRVVKVKKNEIKYSSLLLKAFRGDIKSNLKINLRNALCEIETKYEKEKVLKYSMHATGVLLVLSGVENISFEDENGVDEFIYNDQKYLIGIRNEIKLEDEKEFLINASYVNPEYISELQYKLNLKTDEYFFRASRGSEVDLEFGINYFLNEVNLPIYSGSIDLINEIKTNYINLNLKEVKDIIGDEIEEEIIVNILKRLQFEIEIINDENMRVKIPPFRHDIKNIQDIAEEILRIYGIDKIKSKPLKFKEKNRINKNIKFLEFVNELKLKAVSNGFYEVLHFVFDDKSRLKKYGFEVIDNSIDLINPIVNELDTLRTTLLLQLLEDIQRNKANGYKRIYLFSIGSVYDKNRKELQKMAFVINGYEDYENVLNSGKPKKVSFKTIVDKLSQIIGEFKLIENNSHPIAHPYQNAKIIKDDIEIGVVAKLHPKVAKEFDIDDTYFAEIDLEKLNYKTKKATEINKFPKVIRDLSLVVNKDLTFKYLYDLINSLKIEEIKEFYPIDIYDLKDSNSLTIRFVIQAKKTLTDEEINGIIEKILKALDEKGIKLRC